MTIQLPVVLPSEHDQARPVIVGTDLEPYGSGH